VLNVKR
jgi:trimethylamine monooxygenase